MRLLLATGLGILIGAATLGAVWAASSDGATEVRIAATPRADGSVRVGLQQQNADGAWNRVEHPALSVVPAGADIGRTLYSSPVNVNIDTRANRAARAYQAELLERGAELGQIYDDFLSADDPDAELGTLLCVVDTDDEGVGALCEGIAQTYSGQVDVLESGSWAELRSEYETRFSDPSLAAFFPTSVPTGLLAAEVLEALGLEDDEAPPWIYWIELLEQHTASPDTRFCQIQHSGQVIATDLDLFWGEAARVSNAAAAQLDIQLDHSAHNTTAAQAAKIRECAEHAGAIATTLVEPEALSAAVSDAAAAGAPVVTFNSGAEHAGSAGAAIHIGLDDRQGGRLAGAEFNRQGVTGNVLCIIHEPDNVGLVERCDGFEEVYDGSVERWVSQNPLAVVDEAAPFDVVEEILARLEAGNVDGILTLSVDGAWAARLARTRFDSDVPMGTFGFSLGLANSVSNGSVMFTINDHPEVQAYLSLAAAVMTERWRISPARYFNGTTILIRPQLLDAAYMDALIDAIARNR